jgi:hypothetical protein
MADRPTIVTPDGFLEDGESGLLIRDAGGKPIRQAVPEGPCLHCGAVTTRRAVSGWRPGGPTDAPRQQGSSFLEWWWECRSCYVGFQVEAAKRMAAKLEVLPHLRAEAEAFVKAHSR